MPKEVQVSAFLAPLVAQGPEVFLVCRGLQAERVNLVLMVSMGRRAKKVKTAKMAKMAATAKSGRRVPQVRMAKRDRRVTAVNPSFKCTSMLLKVMWT